jgi:hypothetical protein
MDDEEPAQLVLRQRLGSRKPLEASASVEAPHALVQVVQHLEMDALKDGSDFGFSALEGHDGQLHSENNQTSFFLSVSLRSSRSSRRSKSWMSWGSSSRVISLVSRRSVSPTLSRKTMLANCGYFDLGRMLIKRLG